MSINGVAGVRSWRWLKVCQEQWLPRRLIGRLRNTWKGYQRGRLRCVFPAVNRPKTGPMSKLREECRRSGPKSGPISQRHRYFPNRTGVERKASSHLRISGNRCFVGLRERSELKYLSHRFRHPYERRLSHRTVCPGLPIHGIGPKAHGERCTTIASSQHRQSSLWIVGNAGIVRRQHPNNPFVIGR